MHLWVSLSPDSYCLSYAANMLFRMTHPSFPKELRFVCLAPKLAFTLLSERMKELTVNMIVFDGERKGIIVQRLWERLREGKEKK